MDFFSKFTKPDQSKPASEPNSTTEPSNTDLFSSAKVVAGAAQSYFSHQPPTYENTKVAGATADILGAASEYGKLDKAQGVGKYVDQAESYLKDYESSNTTKTPAAAATSHDTAADAGVKSAPTTEVSEETDTTATKGAYASNEKSTKPESYGEDTKEGLPSKPPAGEAPVETDGLSNKASGGGVSTETDAGGDYTEAGGGAAEKTGGSDYFQLPKIDKHDDISTEEDLPKKPAAAATDANEKYAEGISDKPSSGGAASEAVSGDSGYTEDTEEGLPKPSAGGDASDKVSPAQGGFGNFLKVTGDFSNK